MAMCIVQCEFVCDYCISAIKNGQNMFDEYKAKFNRKHVLINDKTELPFINLKKKTLYIQIYI